MKTVYIGLGSNLDEPVQQIQSAIACLRKSDHFILKKCSSLYLSKPMGPQNQPDFVNAVIEIETDLSPNALLSFLQDIEKMQKRDRCGERWGPRTIDLDILLFENDKLVTKNLKIPHPGLCEREFVVYPLFEIAPQLILPSGEKIADIKAQCAQRGMQVLPFEESESLE